MRDHQNARAPGRARIRVQAGDARTGRRGRAAARGRVGERRRLRFAERLPLERDADARGERWPVAHARGVRVGLHRVPVHESGRAARQLDGRGTAALAHARVRVTLRFFEKVKGRVPRHTPVSRAPYASALTWIAQARTDPRPRTRDQRTRTTRSLDTT